MMMHKLPTNKEWYLKQPPFHCDKCNEYIPYEKKVNHLKSKKHLNNIGLRYYVCQLCNKKVGITSWAYHIQSKKHFDLIPNIVDFDDEDYKEEFTDE